jgi:Zn-dependent protease with chaperone function
MWKDINGQFSRIYWISRWLAELILIAVFVLLFIIGIYWGLHAVAIIIKILFGLIVLFISYWIIKMLVLFFQIKQKR